MTPMGLHKWKGLSIRLASAPEAFQKLMELVFIGFSSEVALVCLNDTVAFEKTFEEHLLRLEQVFALLDTGVFKKNTSERKLFQIRVLFFVHVVSLKGVELYHEKVAVVEKKEISMQPERNASSAELIWFP